MKTSSSSLTNSYQRLPLGDLPGRWTIRRAIPSDSASIARLFAHVYHNSTHPFQNQRDVLEQLSDQRCFQLVAEHDGLVIATAAMTYCAWNDSFELGRALTHPDHREHGIAAALLQPAIDMVSKRGLGSVFFGYPRCRRIVDLCSLLDPPMIATGHDAGRNLANGSRELHLTVYSVQPRAASEHLAPPIPVTDLERGWSRIYRRLRLRPLQGRYPNRSFVGPVHKHSIEVDGLTFDYSPISHALEVIGTSVSGARPNAISARLMEHLDRSPMVKHVTVTVLADKVRLVHELRGYGFDVVAYLPAWYAEGNHRFDCIRLALYRGAETPFAGDLGELHTRVKSDLESLFPFATSDKTDAGIGGCGSSRGY